MHTNFEKFIGPVRSLKLLELNAKYFLIYVADTIDIPRPAPYTQCNCGFSMTMSSLYKLSFFRV